LFDFQSNIYLERLFEGRDDLRTKSYIEMLK